MEKTEVDFTNMRATLIAVEAAVAALIAAHPSPKLIAKFLDMAESGVLSSKALSRQPDRRRCQQSFARLRKGLRK